MVAVIDLAQDVEQKFFGTVVMYDKKACVVKATGSEPGNPGEFILTLGGPGQRALRMVKLTDPLLNYKDFNIGYANLAGRATWWYRKPTKQWAQGLKSNQMGYRVSEKGLGPHEGFSANKSFIAMLENSYPDIETCKKSLKQDEWGTIAFHKDFALSFDDLHEDFLLEYHGSRIGTSLDKDLKQFKIKAEFRHLIEALQEARNAHG